MEVITIRKTFVRFIRTYKEEYSFQKTKNAIISRRGEQISYIRRKNINEEKIYWKVRDYDYFIEKKWCYRSYTKFKSTKHFPVVLHKRVKL